MTLQCAAGLRGRHNSPRHRKDLFKAVRNRDESEITSLMKSGISWTFPDMYGQSVLHVAVQERCNEPHEQQKVIEILGMFLRLKKLKVDVKCNGGRTALHIAVRNGMIEVVDYLIRQGAKLDAKDNIGNGIAHYMVTGEFDKYFELTLKTSSPDVLRPFYRESVHFFKQMLSKKIKVDYANKNRDTPLHVAVGYNLLHILPILLQYTKDVTLYDKQKQNVLHLFIENNDSAASETISSSCYDKPLLMDVFKMILSKGFSVSAVDVNGNTPLHCAVIEDNPTFIKLMLEKYKEVDNHPKNTILHFIIDRCIHYPRKQHKKESAEFVSILLSKDANINARNETGYSPLHLAIMRVHPTILQTLTDHGVDLKESYNGGNLLHLVGQKSSKVINSSKLAEVIALLVSRGCDLNERDKDGMTPLHLAVKTGRNAVIKVLAKCHANIELRKLSTRRLTPLQLAVVEDHELSVNTLLKVGADVNAKDASGKTALHLATQFKNGMVKTLLGYGAHVDVKDDEEFLPLHYAIKNQNGVALAELLKYGADINDIDTYRELLCLDDPGYMLFGVIQHWIKMKAVGMPIASTYKAHASGETYQHIFQDCLKEIEDLKAYKISDSRSLYGLLHMDPNLRCVYTRNKPLKDLIESSEFEKKFPNYHVLILASYHETVARQSLLEPAERAWCELTNIILPHICIYRILAYLRNRDLRVMVDGLKDRSFRTLSNSLSTTFEC